MSLRLYKNEKNSIELRGTTVESLTADVFLSHATNNTSTAIADFDLSEIRVKLLLKKAELKEEVVVMDGDLATLGMYAALKSGGVADGVLADKSVANALTYLAKDTSVKEALMFSVTIPTGFIHLSGSDTLRLECQSNSFITTTLDATASYVDIRTNEGVGVMESVTMVEQVSVPGTQSRYSHTAGDNVSFLAWVNHDVTTNLYADRVISNVSLSSSHINYDLDFIGITGMTADALNYNVDSANYDASFILYDGIPCYDAKLNCVLVGANNTTSKNFIVKEQVFTTNQLIRSANQVKGKHLGKNISKLIK